jgi:hypothetical protein
MFETFFASKVSRRATRRHPPARRPMIELLETRLTPAPFTPGDLVLVRVGTGVGTLTSNATETFLDEYTTAGTFSGNSVELPTLTGRALTLSGTGTTEGYLAGSVDGHTLTIGGYNAVPGNPTFDNTNPVNRVIGAVEPDGTIDFHTQFPQADAGTIRSVASVDGKGFWVATSNFVRYVPFKNPATTSSIAITTLVSSPTVAEIQPSTGLGQTSQLYISGGAGIQSNGFPAIDSPATVGNGLPITGGQTVQVPGEFPTASTNGAFPTTNQFIFSPDGNTVYIADGRTNGDGGLLVYHRSNSFSPYSRALSMTFPTNGLRGLVADFTSVAGHVILYATTTESNANRLIKLDDDGSSISVTPLATAAANEVFRGVAFTPTLAATTRPTVTLTIDTSTGTTYGTEPTLRATVTGSAGTPTGWVSFRLNSAAGAEIGAAPLVNGMASLQATTNLPAGTDTVVAVYTGNGTYKRYHSAAQTVTIAQAGTNAAVTFSANPIGTHAPEILTAAITINTFFANDGFSYQPTGTVTFFANGNPIIGAVVNVTSSVVNVHGTLTQLFQANFTTSFPHLGSQDITAVYSGDANYATSTSPDQSLSVVYKTRTTVTTSDPNPLASSGERVTLTATVTSKGGTPTGTVTFYDNLIQIGSPVTLVNGSGSVSLNTNSVQAPRGAADLLTPGLHSITAIYTPDPAGSSIFYHSQSVYEQAVQADPFGAADIFVMRVGDGTTPIIAPPPSPYAGGASIGNTIFVDEYTPPVGGHSTLVQSIILPTADGEHTALYNQKNIHAVVADGQQSTTGQLTLSGDGQYLFLTGYDSNPLPVATAPELHYVNSTSRAVARIRFDGLVQTIGFVAGPITGANSPPVQTGGLINGVFSPDGNQFYVSGFNGIDYFANFRPTKKLQTFTARIDLTNFTVNGLEAAGGNLFAVGGSGTGRTIGQVGTGFPTMPASIVTVPGFPGINSNPAFPVDVYFTHLDGPGAPAGINTMYVGDDGPSFSQGTITKWSFDGINWSLTGTVQADGTAVVSFYWLAGQTSGNTVTLYSTYGNGGNGDTGRGDLYQLIDTAGYGRPFSSSVVTTIASVDSMSLENLRGVAFAPEPAMALHASNVNTLAARQLTTLVATGTGQATLLSDHFTVNYDSATVYDSAMGVNPAVSSATSTETAFDARSLATAGRPNADGLDRAFAELDLDAQDWS